MWLRKNHPPVIKQNFEIIPSVARVISTFCLITKGDFSVITRRSCDSLLITCFQKICLILLFIQMPVVGSTCKMPWLLFDVAQGWLTYWHIVKCDVFIIWRHSRLITAFGNVFVIWRQRVITSLLRVDYRLMTLQLYRNLRCNYTKYVIIFLIRQPNPI